MATLVVVKRELVVRVRVNADELAAIDEAAWVSRRGRSETVRLAFVNGSQVAEPAALSVAPAVDVPVFAEPVVAGWSFTPSASGVAELDRLADRESCSRDEVARRVFKYGAWKMPPGFRG